MFFITCLCTFLKFVLANPMSCYISNVVYCLFVFFLFVLAGRFFLFHECLLIYTCGIDIVLF